MVDSEMLLESRHAVQSSAQRKTLSTDGSLESLNADGPLHAEVNSVALPDQVTQRLRKVRIDAAPYEMYVLPPYQRDGCTLYGSDDLVAVRLARGVGLRAAFLDSAEDREYLQEYSAGYLVQFAVAFAANVATLPVTPLVDYIKARVRYIIDRGLHSGPEENVPISVTVAQYRRGADG